MTTQSFPSDRPDPNAATEAEGEAVDTGRQGATDDDAETSEDDGTVPQPTNEGTTSGDAPR